MRKYRDDETKGIFSLLLRKNFARILWSILALILCITIMAAVFFPLANMPYFTLWMVRNRLIHEKYDNIDNFGITDGRGSFEIINDEYSVIYPENVSKSYAAEEIESMWEVDYLRAKAVKNTYTKDGNSYTQIICSGTDMYRGWFLLVDEGFGYVDSANFPIIKNRYTEEDLDYYLNDLIFERGTYKYEFVTDKGRTHHMIIRFDSPAVILDEREVNILIYTAAGLALLFIVFIFLSINSVSRRFRKPIRQLDEAMSGFSNDDYAGINIDHRGVREIKNVINTFNDMVYKLQASKAENIRLSQEKQDLIADISHDLKTPITIIQGYTDALSQGKIAPGEKQDYIDKINKKAIHLTRLINEFSDYSKLDYTEFKLNLEKTDLCGFVRDFMAENYSYMIDNGFRVLIDIPDEKYICGIDRTHFKRCLENIISNFVKYNPGGATIHAGVSALPASYSVVLKNDGEPIDSRVAGNLFDPFVMGDKSRKAGMGSGLGLAVVRKIVELHGGTVEYYNSVEYANCFKVSLPRVKMILNPK